MPNGEDTLELIKKAASGDVCARERVYAQNVALVKSIVRGFIGRGTEYEDLFQIGSIGLLKAIDGFKPDMGVKFSTYAVPMISGEIRRFLRDDGIVKISRSIKENAAKLSGARHRLEAKGIFEPTVTELAKEAGISTEDAAMALDTKFGTVSLDSAVSPGEGEATLMDLIGIKEGDDGTEAIIEKLDIELMMEKLGRVERRVIELRFVRGMTQSRIAELIGTSQVQVSRMIKRVISKMRESE